MVADLTPPWETGRLGNSPDATCPKPQPEDVQKSQILTSRPDLIRGDPENKQGLIQEVVH